MQQKGIVLMGGQLLLQASACITAGESRTAMNQSTLMNRIVNRFLIGATLLSAPVLLAGPVELEPKEMAPPPRITESDHWYFNIGMPGWLAFVSGDIGLHGITSDVDVGFDKIITHVAGIASISAEARYGRFGVYGDFLYMSLSAGVYGDGLVKKANLTLDQYLADGELYYRVLEGPRGSLDLRAGGRYLNMFNRLELSGRESRINQAAAALVAAATEDLRGLLERLLRGALDSNKPPLPVPPLGAEVKIRLLRFIREARQNPMTAQQKIVTILNTRLNGAVSLTEDWTDPYFGLAGRYNLSKAFYLTGKADVGGFGVGSDVTVQAYGALGCHVTRSIYSELGFRYLYEDYDSNGFLYKVSTYGPQVTAGMIF